MEKVSASGLKGAGVRDCGPSELQGAIEEQMWSLSTHVLSAAATDREGDACVQRECTSRGLRTLLSWKTSMCLSGERKKSWFAFTRPV